MTAMNTSMNAAAIPRAALLAARTRLFLRTVFSSFSMKGPLVLAPPQKFLGYHFPSPLRKAASFFLADAYWFLTVLGETPNVAPISKES